MGGHSEDVDGVQLGVINGSDAPGIDGHEVVEVAVPNDVAVRHKVVLPYKKDGLVSML